jgi:HK97 family phage prohead protease
MDAFVWNDETVINSYGFIVLNAGGRFDRFETNPIMLLQHKDQDVIGRWTDRKIEGSLLIATPEYDEADELAAKTKGRVERGFLKGCSLGIDPLKWELKSMPDGNIVPIVTEWEWLETSLCSIPSNGSSVKLYHQGREMSSEEIKSKVLQLTMSNQNNDKMEFKLTSDAYKALQLGEIADAAEISSAIIALKTKADKAEATLAAQKKAAAEELVNAALSKGQITADKKDSFIALATNDFQQAKTILSSIPEKKQLGNQVKEGAEINLGANREDWDMTRWRKEDSAGLQLMKKQDPERYEALLSNLDSKLKSQGVI